MLASRLSRPPAQPKNAHCHQGVRSQKAYRQSRRVRAAQSQAQAEAPPHQHLQAAAAEAPASLGLEELDVMAEVPGTTENVPGTLREAARLFPRHPTPAAIIAGLLVLAYYRAQAPWQPADALVALATAGFWLGQEWAVHRWLLHSAWAWPGRGVHEGHHLKPYYHISIDSPALVLPAMAASGAALWAGLGGSGLALTATGTYWAMGLAYEWTHYMVHTRAVPRSALGRRVRRHHMLHHCRSEQHWFAFLVPGVDAALGTAPEDPGSVPRTALARKGAAA